MEVGSHTLSHPKLSKLSNKEWKNEIKGSKNHLEDELGIAIETFCYPYGDYKTNNEFFIFTASPSNRALPNKERIYAILGDEVSKVYQFQKFNGGKVIKDVFNGTEYLVVGNADLIYSFELNESQSTLNFEYDFNNSESFFKDNEGNKWSIFGKAIEGPRAGEVLKASKSVVSFWFAIAAFYPNPLIY
ncbi:MAG: hypothetical protein COC22_03380 [Flavobacteriaceae bacterium]|nr:MAG: hypothetical protein COC22_03380 [Flavobacteriaceae bacterium]